jgi:hypothetical protein
MDFLETWLVRFIGGRSDRLADHRGRYRYRYRYRYLCSVDGVAALSQHPQADLAARGCEVRPPCARTPAGALRIVDLEAQEQA